MDRSQRDEIKKIRAFFLKGISPQGGAFLVASIADILSDGLTIEETVALAGFLGSISQTMGYISAQRALNEHKAGTAATVEDTPLPTTTP